MMLMFLVALGAAETPEQIIKAMDENMTFGTRIADVEMSVKRAGGDVEVKKMKLWARGQQDSYVEFVSPPRDKGVKYLKLEGNLYMFLPSTEKVVKISGHLLRQSLMDSDFSYEDMLESKKLLDNYNAALVGEEAKSGEDAWVLDLTAKSEGQTYEKRKLWISKKTHLPLLEQRFAKTGVLLKEYAVEESIAHGKRFYPKTSVMRDKLKEGTETRLTMTNITFDAEIPERLFSRRNLMGRD
jgi:outer membrane lipoprotein-sorting protein